jgi:hypothetical protein
MLGRNLADVHTEPGYQAIEDEFEKSDEQHQLNGVFEQQSLIFDPPG